MLMKRVERLLEKMTERNDHQHHPQSQHGGADPQANQDQRARNQLDEGDGESDYPQGPRREKGVSVRQEPLSHMPGWSLSEDLVNTCHEEDQTQYETSKEQRKGS